MSDMIGAFSYNGITSQSFKLIGRSVKRPLLPAAHVKRVDIPSASGVYDFEDEAAEYTMRPITMQLAYIGNDYYELRQRARQIAAWLAVSRWGRLVMDDEKSLYYLAKVTSELDLQNLWQSGTIDVEFDCQPFAYSVQEQTVGSGNFLNPGTRHIDFRSPPGSKFTITASVGSSASFTMNNRILTYSGNPGTLVLDHVNMEAKLEGVNVFGRLGGDVDLFFQLRPGENNLTVNGADGVVVNYIPMWY